MKPAINDVDCLERAEREALLFLREHGGIVRLVPRSQELTPEFEVELHGERYLFEVKARRDDEAIDDVEPGEVFTQSQHLFWSAGVYKNVRKAVRQMRQHDPRHERLWIVWLHAEAPIAGDAVEEQIRGTLLGTHAIVDLASMLDRVVSQKAEAGRAYQMNPTIGRSESEVQQHLRSAYGLKMPILLRPQSHRGLAVALLDDANENREDQGEHA